MAGAAVLAAERGPARLARARRSGPVVRARARPPSQAAARPSSHSTRNAPITPPIITAATRRVGAVHTDRTANPIPARIANSNSGDSPEGAPSWRRSRAEGWVERARANGPSEKAAAAFGALAAARSSGAG